MFVHMLRDLHLILKQTVIISNGRHLNLETTRDNGDLRKQFRVYHIPATGLVPLTLSVYLCSLLILRKWKRGVELSSSPYFAMLRAFRACYNCVTPLMHKLHLYNLIHFFGLVNRLAAGSQLPSPSLKQQTSTLVLI